MATESKLIEKSIHIHESNKIELFFPSLTIIVIAATLQLDDACVHDIAVNSQICDQSVLIHIRISLIHLSVPAAAALSRSRISEA